LVLPCFCPGICFGICARDSQPESTPPPGWATPTPPPRQVHIGLPSNHQFLRFLEKPQVSREVEGVKEVEDMKVEKLKGVEME